MDFRQITHNDVVVKSMPNTLVLLRMHIISPSFELPDTACTEIATWSMRSPRSNTRSPSPCPRLSAMSVALALAFEQMTGRTDRFRKPLVGHQSACRSGPCPTRVSAALQPTRARRSPSREHPVVGALSLGDNTCGGSHQHLIYRRGAARKADSRLAIVLVERHRQFCILQTLFRILARTL